MLTVKNILIFNLILLWVAFPILINWGNIYTKNNRFLTLHWQMFSLIVVLPALIFFGILGLIVEILKAFNTIASEYSIWAIKRILPNKDK